jgi:VWFA-related protein
LLLGAALLLLSQLNSGEAPAVTYRKSVEEVRLEFFATDQTGRAVSHLTTDDFDVVDNDWVVRDFRSFNSAETTNLEVAVLFDASESLGPEFQHEMRNVAYVLSQPRWLPGDSVSLLSFSGSQPRTLCAGDCAQLPPATALFPTQASGSTPLFDALVSAADFLDARRRNHLSTVVILFSDGNDTISRHTLADALDAIMAAGVYVYVVDMTNPATYSPGRAVLRKLAAVTGGRYFSLHDGAANVLARMIEDLHAGYVVTYKPATRESGRHTVQVLPATNRMLEFHCRNSYYYRDDHP